MMNDARIKPLFGKKLDNSLSAVIQPPTKNSQSKNVKQPKVNDVTDTLGNIKYIIIETTVICIIPEQRINKLILEYIAPINAPIVHRSLDLGRSNIFSTENSDM